ncbi:sensor protein KdpD [Abditibacteriota bacterium]|nr:sensor protein KdpD [Abditibacteriota bacterium]
MLYEFLIDNRDELISRCQFKVAQRFSPQESPEEIQHGIPLFLDQLIKTLQIERTPEPLQSRKVSGPAGGGNGALSEIGEGATQHGRELLKRGFTVDQVVHAYGDLCQAISDLAFERGMPFEIDEYRTLNRCLDNAIASAVTEFQYQHNFSTASQHAQEWNQRLGFLAHELRNHLTTATLALSILKGGEVGLTGATGDVLERSLRGLRSLIDRSLAEVRMTAEAPLYSQLFSLADFITEVKIASVLEAQFRGCTFNVSAVDRQLAVEADRDLLFSALSNLLQNAFKFTHRQSEVSLNAYAVGARVLIDVQDHCGGLPPGFVEQMFQPFTQGSEDRSGVGLGLSIARRSIEANHGTLRVRDIPGSGCVFTIDLPRHTLLQSSTIVSL